MLNAELRDLEALLNKIEADRHNECVSEARKLFKLAISSTCEISADNADTITKVIETASLSSRGRRDAAIISLRALSIDGFFPIEHERQLERCLVSLIQGSFSDALKYLRLDEKRQTHELINLLKGVHQHVLDLLRPLTKTGNTFSSIEGSKSEILKLVVTTHPSLAYSSPDRAN